MDDAGRKSLFLQTMANNFHALPASSLSGILEMFGEKLLDAFPVAIAARVQPHNDWSGPRQCADFRLAQAALIEADIAKAAAEEIG